jgi:serine phosphatase RsbU (regulator of sigma subunit)
MDQDHVLDPRRARALCDLTTKLMAASDAPTMAVAIAETAHRIAGATYAQLGLPSDAGDALVLYHGPALDRRAQMEWPVVPLDLHTPVGQVMAAGKPVACQSATELVDLFPVIQAASEASGYESLIVVPLLDPLRPDQCAGTLSFAWVERDRATDGAIGVMTDLAARCALALARVSQSVTDSRSAAEDRRAALALQQSLLSSLLVDHPLLTYESRYISSVDELVVGGDWYDAVPLPDGRVAIAVGDVAGHGFDAALAMGQIRHDLEALAAHHRQPDKLLEVLDLLVGERGAPMTTAAIAYLDPERLRVAHVLAGHPPPILLQDGAARLLDQSRGLPLGTALAARSWPAATTTTVKPGDTLVLYTDGLIERRGEDISRGFERLLETVQSAATAELDVLCDHVVGSMFDGQEPHDDVALLAARIAVA